MARPRIFETTQVETLDGKPGTYVLVLACGSADHIVAGRLGEFDIQPGLYLYVGSALGPGGVRARVIRHARPNARRNHWHIDYLTARLPIDRVWFTFDPHRLEHAWAGALRAMRGVSIAILGFGCTDCRCESHLFHSPSPPSLISFRRRVGATIARPNGSD